MKYSIRALRAVSVDAVSDDSLIVDLQLKTFAIFLEHLSTYDQKHTRSIARNSILL